MNVDFTSQILQAKEKKTLNKPFRTPNGPKKFSVYVKNEKGNIVKVNFGDPNMEIKRDDPDRRRNFRARHNCDNAGPKTKARYWSCKFWESKKSVSDYLKGSSSEWDGETFFDHDQLLADYPDLAFVEEEITEASDCECGSDCGCSSPSCENCNCQDGSTCDCECHSSISEAQKRYGGKKRSELKDSDFLDPERRSFPIVSCQDVKDAVSSWGLYRGEMTFDQFKERLTKKAKSIGCESSLPKTYSKADIEEYEDHEVSMAASQMMKIARQSTQLAMMLKDMPESNMMAWTQDKISKAEHYVEAVYDYMMYNNSNAALTEKQKKLPPALQKAILKKKSDKPQEDKKQENENEDKEKEPSKKGLTEKQKKLPPALQKAILKKQSKAEYEMTYDEYNQVMDFNDVIESRRQLEEDYSELFSAKRSGPKSAAQTPAKPSERKRGSSKNKKGSAGKNGPAIKFSEQVTKSLKNKVKEHNAKYSKKVTLSQLKKVYRRGAGAFSSSHRPGKTRGQWAMARVNMFLKMKRGGKVKDSYRAADGDI